MSHINREIYKLIREKSGLSNPGIYHKISKKKEELGYAFSNNTTAIVLASDLGIDVFPYLSEDELIDYREARKMGPTIIKEVNRQVERPPVKIIFSDKIDIDCPNLPQNVFQDAKRMSEVYPYFFIFENSIRFFIINTLEEKYGENWWEKCVNPETIKKVKERIKKEDKNPWHGKRGQHPIFYSDIGHLRGIIQRNQNVFYNKLPEKPLEWLTTMIWIIEQSRNTIAHNNPLDDLDIERVKINLKDWIRQIEDNKGK